MIGEQYQRATDQVRGGRATPRAGEPIMQRAAVTCPPMPRRPPRGDGVQHDRHEVFEQLMRLAL